LERRLASGDRSGSRSLISNRSRRSQHPGRVAPRGKKAKTLTYPFRSCAEATPDQLIDAWIAEDRLPLTDMTLVDLARAVISARAKAFTAHDERHVANDRTPTA
jgi:hypothetical protein